MDSKVVKSIITIFLLLTLIVACLFAIKNTSDPATIKIKKLNDFKLKKEYEEQFNITEWIKIENIVEK